MTPTDPTRPPYRLPRTEAGRALSDRATGLWWQPNPLAGANAMQSAQTEVREAILAIEDQAERAAPPPAALREAIHRHRDGCNGRPHRRWYLGQNKCDTLAALAQPAPAPTPVDDLGAAWAAAEAALPDGWDLMVGHTTKCKWCSGWWATASKRLEEPPHYPRIVSSETDRPRGEHHDATPAAALRALAARLAATKAGSS